MDKTLWENTKICRIYPKDRLLTDLLREAKASRRLRRTGICSGARAVLWEGSGLRPELLRAIRSSLSMVPHTGASPLTAVRKEAVRGTGEVLRLCRAAGDRRQSRTARGCSGASPGRPQMSSQVRAVHGTEVLLEEVRDTAARKARAMPEAARARAV